MQINLEKFTKPCPCGKKHEITVKKIYLEPHAVNRLSGILDEYTCPVLICDTNTKRASETAMKDYFESHKVIELPPENLHADNQTVDLITTTLPSSADILVAVGSGTIHDLVRYVSGAVGIPFIAVPTAASVDGFVSNMAAMTWHGLKKSFVSVAPLYVVADTNIFANAPYRLTASGISDLMGKYTALADWELAHIITDEYFCQHTRDLVMQTVSDVEGAIELFAADKNSAIAAEKLMYALLMSGIAMQMAGNSRPASGAEHHISHLWEMAVINNELDALHGEKVSIGLLLTLERYERALNAIKSGTYAFTDKCEMETKLLQDTFGKRGLYDLIMDENGGVLLEPAMVDNFKQKIGAVAKVLGKLPTYTHIKQMLESVGCLTTMEQIGLNDNLKELTLALCPYVKNRLTMMRLMKAFEY